MSQSIFYNPNAANNNAVSFDSFLANNIPMSKFNTNTNNTLSLADDILNTESLLGNGDLNGLINFNNGDTFLGLGRTGWGAIGLGMQAGLGLVNAFQAAQQLEMAKKQYKFQKNLANRNLANQAKIINNTYDNAAQVAAGMRGSANGKTDPAVVQQYVDRAKSQYVDGSPI